MAWLGSFGWAACGIRGAEPDSTFVRGFDCAYLQELFEVGGLFDLFRQPALAVNLVGAVLFEGLEAGQAFQEIRPQALHNGRSLLQLLESKGQPKACPVDLNDIGKDLFDHFIPIFPKQVIAEKREVVQLMNGLELKIILPPE